MSSWRAGCGGTRTSGSGERVGETVAREGGDAPRLDSHAWLATRTDKTTITQVLRIDWDTVGRIIKRVCDDELDPDRLNGLFEIGIDEVSWKKPILTLIADHCVVWGASCKRVVTDRSTPSSRARSEPAAPPAARGPATTARVMVPSARARPSPPATASRPLGLHPAASSTRRSSRAPPSCAPSRWT